MSLYTKILIPLDGSKLAEGALAVLDQDLLPEEHEVLLVTVVDPAVSRAFADFASAEQINLYQAVERYQGDIAGELRDRGIKARPVTASDVSAADGILEVAEHETPSVLVISSHGRGAVGRWLLGSVAEKLVRGAPCPILVVPAR